MQIDILTTFPLMFSGPFSESIVKRAQEKGVVQIKIHDLRNWAKDKRRTTDDRPYGGGPGMVMLVEPIDLALAEIGVKKGTPGEKIILTSAKGALFVQKTVQAWTKELKRLVIISGHYEGVDERVALNLVDEEVRIGDYVLTGGELPAAVIVDAVVRLLPGVLGDESSTVVESHSEPGYLEYPQFTRPDTYKGWEVPKVLQNGNHKEIEEWREKKH